MEGYLLEYAQKIRSDAYTFIGGEIERYQISNITNT